MLDLKSIAFPENLLVIEEEPIFVNEKLSKSVIKSDAQVEQDKATRRYRTGKVIAHGRIVIDTNSTTFSSTMGESQDIKLNTIVLYDASIVDVNDCPVEYENQHDTPRKVVYLNRNMIHGIIEE